MRKGRKGMAKLEIDKSQAFYPMPCSLVGAKVDGKPNYLTVSLFSMVNREPPFLAVALNKDRYTNSGIKEYRTFSINIPSVNLAEQTDYCGMVSGRSVDKSNLFETFYGKLETAPMIRECPICFECRLVRTVDLPSKDLFIGEIITAYCDEDCLTDGAPDVMKINPFLLIDPERKYLSLGQEIGRAWEMGKNLKRIQTNFPSARGS